MSKNKALASDQILSRELLDYSEWKVEHRPDGLSFIGYPYRRNGRTEYGWVLGPMDRHVAEWLFDAIHIKQEAIKDGMKNA